MASYMDSLDEGLRLELINWLESNDRNGMYSDEDAIAEDIPPMTLQIALAITLNQILEGTNVDEYDSAVDLVKEILGID